MQTLAPQVLILVWTNGWVVRRKSSRRRKLAIWKSINPAYTSVSTRCMHFAGVRTQLLATMRCVGPRR